MFFADVSPFQYIVDFIFFLQTFEPHVKIKENGFPYDLHCGTKPSRRYSWH
jgi:hypothetical protein